MPALEPVPGVARVVHEGTFAGVLNWACIFHIARFDTTSGARQLTSWSQADIDALVVAMRDEWSVRWRTLLHTTITLTSTSAVDLTDEFGAVATDTQNVAGTLAGTACPAQVAQCISWREALHYRGGHPRTYLPPPSMTQVSSTPNTWGSTHVTAVELAANGFLTDLDITVLGTNKLGLVAVHRVRNHALLIPPSVVPITAASFDNRVDTQRRRLGGDV